MQRDYKDYGQANTRYSKPQEQTRTVVTATIILIAVLFVYDTAKSAQTIMETIGQFYITISVVAFTVGLVWLAMVGVRMVLFDASRGREEAMRDVQLGLAARADIVRAEVKSSLMKDED